MVTGLLGRIGAFFLEPAEPSSSAALDRPPEGDAPPFAAAPATGPGVPAAAPATDPGAAAAAPAGAAVLGAPAAVVPVAAACAGELRAREQAAAAVICTWRPLAAPLPEPDAPVQQSPAGATTPGARRLAARLVARDLAATACGRLAWLALDPEPELAAGQFRRCRAAAGVPLVLAVAGARPAAFEPLLEDLDLTLAVLAADIDPALRALALARLPGRARLIVAPLPPGPPRWAAMAGLARLRSLPRPER